MKKTEVYVVVDTPKKAKKLKKVLDMFGESHFSDIHKVKFNDCVGNVVHFWQNKYFAYCSSWAIKNKTEVSIKELRNILAREYLKYGDVALFEDKGYKVLGIYKQYSDIFKDFVCEKIEGNSNTTTGFHNFIRYATEEEKALLEPKKELEVGKWYRLQSNNLVFTTSELSRCHVSGYGFSHGGKLWSDEYPNFLVQEFTEATSKEVEQALIEEAKRRGYKEGVVVKPLIIDMTQEEYTLGISEGKFYENKCSLYVGSILVFQYGQWATIIEQDKFAELKEAHSNGEVIESMPKKWIGDWTVATNPIWDGDNYEYRIKPEEKTNLTAYDISIVERLHYALLDNHGYSLESKLLTDARMLSNKIKSNIK